MKISVIGLGSIGKRHIKNLLSIGKKDIIGYDPSFEKRKQVEELGIKTTSNYEETLFADAVFICSPTKFHIQQAIDFAKNNCHIFLEKPVSDSMEGIEELRKLVDEKKLIVQIGFNFRFHPKYKKILEIIPKIGNIISTRSRFVDYLPKWRPSEDYRFGYGANKNLGGGVILDSCHEIDYITSIIGNVTEIVSFNGKQSNLEINTEDTADILLRHENNATTSINLSYAQKLRSRGWTIVGDEGIIDWDIVKDTLEIYTDKFQKTIEEKDSIDKTFIDEILHFFNCIKTNNSPLVNLDQGVKVLKICIAAKESQKQKKFISLK